MNAQEFPSLLALITTVTAAGYPTLADVHGDLPLQARYQASPTFSGHSLEIAIWQDGEGWVHLGFATHAPAATR